MTEQPLDELERHRAELYARLAGTGDFRPGSVNETWRRCGKPNCACAQPGHPGHGPRYLWTRSAGGRTRTRQLAAAELDKVRREIANYKQFVAVTEQIVQVNEAICEARPVPSPAAAGGDDGAPPAGRGKRGLWEALAAEASAEIGTAGRGGGPVAGLRDAGLEAAEAVIRAGMLKLGGGVLGKLLAADPGYRGPRADCGQGHQAEFVSYRDKVIDTVLGPVTLTRAWYHCAACGHGLAPRDAELGVAGAVDVAGAGRDDRPVAAAGPFAKAAGLLEDLAGVHLTAKRVERSAEASGTAKAAADRGRAAGDHRPHARAAAAVAAAGQAVRRDRRHRRAGDREGGRRAGRQGRGRPRPHPRGQARRLLHPGQGRRRGLPGPRPRILRPTWPPSSPPASSLAWWRPRASAAARDHVRQLTILGDGAAWIWNIATAKFPEATQIVDLYHAREHLHDLARVLEFMLGDQREELARRPPGRP